MSTDTDTDRLADLLAVARRAGADEADAVYFSGTSLSVSRRLGQIEHVERSEGRDLGLRVFVGERSAIVSAPGLDPATFADIAERAVTMARLVPADPLSGLLDIGPIPTLDLDMADTAEPDAAALGLRAGTAEDAALAVAGITNSEGADASYSRSEAVLVTSRGFAGSYRRTGYSVSATALAGSGTEMQRDYDYTSAVHLADLDDPARIGRSAGERALARLNPTRPKTAKLPVIYDPRVSATLVGHLAGAVNGAGIARGTSFLREKMGQQIFGRGITIRDDPHRVRGLRSRPFDGEGQPTTPLDIVADGVLTTWVLDGRSAPPAWPENHRQCRARHLRSAEPLDLQPLSCSRQPEPRGADVGYQGRSVCDRVDRLRHQRHYRRLQPRCRRLHDPQWPVGRACRRGYHCRQSHRHVRASGAGQ